MINKHEIISYASKNQLPANTVEKDYILNWLLFGIQSSNRIKNKWVFKGGTCLKKCFFKEYRFSEDLDFTIIDESHTNNQFLTNTFIAIAEWIYENSGIEIPNDRITFEEYENPRGFISVEGKIPFKGPMQRRGNYPTIKLNLSHDEILALDSVSSPIFHPYSDLPQRTPTIESYCIEEIMAEKLRALVERLSPRDLYDVIHIHFDKNLNPQRDIVETILRKKCEFKKVEIPTMSILDKLPAKQAVYADWQDMLAHQINNLEPCEYYWERLPKVFSWLHAEN